ncbi:MAG: gliding motility-associated C-terminal domain-containing protein [Saprospiraceae bacterium]|nr:gliding motility-associated C-terminal domain-containing protein [Saprospiraceae bacterium]
MPTYLRHFLILFLFLSQQAWAQQDTCRCLQKTVTTVCYLSVNDYCLNIDGCEHTLDGDFMRNSLALKLKNLQNFGPDGISECALELKRMPKITSPQQIADAGCDIFFTGSFAVDTLSFRLNSDKTSVPTPTLNAIRSWSMACDRNLVIVAQAEAKPWGYTIRNQNENPNTAISDPSKFSIFNGIFGSLTAFQQGGSYQGVITNQPTTGVEILAKDAYDRPTVAFDVATRDLILGDIGILCNPAGFLSNGSQIRTNNENDVLAGNLFALGCQIGLGKKFTEETIYKCREESVTLPDGTIVDVEAIFVDTFLTSKGCDSFHYTKILDYEQPNVVIKRSQCQGDSSRLVVGNFVFDESNPSGVALLTDSHGCDSIVSVNLKYYAHTSSSYRDTFCAQSGFVFFAGTDVYSVFKPAGITKITNVNGCDSTITVDINYIHPDTTLIRQSLCYHDSLEYLDNYLFPDKDYVYQYKSKNPCDSFVIFELTSHEAPLYTFENEVVINEYAHHQFDNTFPQNGAILWEDHPGLSCLNCEDPIYSPVDYAPLLKATYTDDKNCRYPLEVRLKYKCDPILPNVISASSQGPNAGFTWTSNCPVEQFNLRIYDRWGNLMFHAQQPQQSWIPTRLVPGVYTYIAEYFDANGHQQKTGDITVVR